MKLKKLLFILLLFSGFISCSDDDNSSSQNQKLSPPDWIIGTWKYDVGMGGTYKAEFTKDNLIFTVSNAGLEIPRNFVEESKETTIRVTLDEPVKTDTDYHVSITRGEGTMSATNTYKFKRKSNTEIIYEIVGNELDPVLTKE